MAEDTKTDDKQDLLEMFIEDFSENFKGKIFRDREGGRRYKVVGLEPKLSMDNEKTGGFYLRVVQLDYENADGYWDLNSRTLERLEEVKDN